MAQKFAVLAALFLVLSLPFLVRATSSTRTHGANAPAGSPTLVVITPHVEQIRDEFERAFDRWYFRTKGSHAAIDWRIPGGTSDIMKQLESTLDAAAKDGRIDDKGIAKPGAAGCDVFFGGGSYEHGKLKDQHKVITANGKTITYRMSQPAGFTQKQLDDWFGPNKIGTQFLYDPDQSWIGTALSGFGIVFNKDVLNKLGAPEPKSFEDLGNFRLFNMVALADGRQSGSVTTTYDAIMNNMGWDKGWRTLREMCANARYFASSSTKPPIDVSQGDAAAGLAIDFYGRNQAQSLLRPGQDPSEARVGYNDPIGAVYIDADPATILNGAQNVDLAKSFIEFCLTEEAQALWQFPPTTPSPASAGEGGQGSARPGEGAPLGPDQYALRRMPVRRDMYTKYSQHFIDKTNPFEIASDVKSRGWRNLIAPLMAAFAIDTTPELREAWQALNHARALAKESRFPSDKLAEMEQAFYALPPHTMRDGTILELNEANFKAIEKDTAKWKDLEHGKRSLIAYTQFFRTQYRKVTALAKSAAPT